MAPHKKFNKKRYVSKRKSHRNLYIAIGLIAIIVIAGAFFFVNTYKPREMTGLSRVLLQTSMGNITIQLRTDKPITSENFRSLVEQGKYDNTSFHRIMAGFMIQGGEINGYSQTIPDEIGSNNSNVAYSVAMANTGQANSASSSFFINVANNGNNAVDAQGTKFDTKYTVFGNVIEGINVVFAISQVPVGPNPQRQSEMSSPLQPVTLIKASMLP
jgi:cyclophilin family peptidyl-prolyl cis-trans isomerase